ncbi:hypothetical protein JD969_19800 [Planctomycetota bacterium]|nr:hypothetical protein JD969_19800 [Planctomycetota bacterium]
MKLLATSITALTLCSGLSATVFNDYSRFTEDAVVESFEGIASAGNNLELGNSRNFSSGITITNDYSQNDTQQPYIVNAGFYGSSPADIRVPHGTAYLGQASAGSNDSGIWVILPEEVELVGCYITTNYEKDENQAAINFEAYDSEDNLLATELIRNISMDEWADSFFGFSGLGGISKIRFDGFGGILRVDKLTYEVPEPSSLALASLALPALLMRKRK